MFATLYPDEFNCPYCNKQYFDNYKNYKKEMSTNSTYSLIIKCDCPKSFGLTSDIKGNLISFKIENENDDFC